MDFGAGSETPNREMKTISTILLVIFLIASPFLLYGFGSELVSLVGAISIGDKRWQAFLIGSVVFFPIYLIASRFLSTPWEYISTLEHEFAHLVVGLLFLKIPVGFRVSAHDGGEVKQIGFGTTGDTWITLAPYFLPTLPLLIVLIAWFVEIPEAYLMGVLGWSTFFHIITNWAETSFRQPDLKKAGALKCFLILPLMNVICYGGILAYVGGANPGFKTFWIEGGKTSIVAARITKDFVMEQVAKQLK